MPRTDDMVFPGGNEGDPIPIRVVRRDMVKKMITSQKIGLLNLATLEMARDVDEKRALVAGANYEDIIVAWAGDRWTDFFHFAGPEAERVWAALISGLTPRSPAMLTEQEQEALQLFRQGALIPAVVRPARKKTTPKAPTRAKRST